MMTPLHVLLVDDHLLFRQGLASVLANRAEVRITGQASNGLEAIHLARQTRPDVILMDVHMPKCDGLTATKIIKQELPQIHIVMLTVSEDDDDLFQALNNGASGYLLKDLEPQELFDCLEKIPEGEAALSGLIATKILKSFNQVDQQPDEAVNQEDGLTPRESEVLEELVKGLTNKEIADSLNITENTVKIHLRHILKKLQLQNRVQVAVRAVREGLVDQPGESF